MALHFLVAQRAYTFAAQGRAKRRSRKAPPWVTGHPRKIALKGQNIRISDQSAIHVLPLQGEIYHWMA